MFYIQILINKFYLLSKKVLIRGLFYLKCSKMKKRKILIWH